MATVVAYISLCQRLTRDASARADARGITGNLAGDGMQTGGTIVVSKGKLGSQPDFVFYMILNDFSRCIVILHCMAILWYPTGGSEVMYLFKQQSFADHAPNEEILKALGIEPKAD